jgi:hypothetical protein
MMAARSLVADGDFDLANDYADPSNIVFDGKLERGLHALPGRGGRLYPVHDVGLPLLAAPYFAAAWWVSEQAALRVPAPILARARLNRWILLRQLISFGMIGLATVLAGLFFRACRDGGGSPQAAAVWAALWTISPPMLGPSFAFFTELPTALIALSVYLASRRPWPWPRARAALLGFAAGLLMLIHARNAPLALALAVLVIVRAGSPQARALAAGAAVAALALRTFITWWFWGTLLTTPHASFAPATPAQAVMEPASRLLAWLFDVEHGLLPWSPAYLLLPAGFWLLRRARPDMLREVLWLSAPYLLAIALPVVNRHGWRGGWSPAARFLVPVMPFLALGIVHALMRCRRWITATLAALQLALDAVYWSRPQLLWEDGDGHSALMDTLGRALHVSFSWWPSWTWPPAPLLAACAIALALWALLTAVLTPREYRA